MGSMAKSLVRKLAVLLGFAGMVAVNWLGTTGQINNVTTTDISDAYTSLFTPAGYAFSIWGLIYLLLLIYVLFQLFSASLGKDGKLSGIALWFAASCILNIGWIFAWHYRQIIVSAAVIILLLICLMRILTMLLDTPRTFGNLFSLEIPFGLYAGWITVATISNIAALLVSLVWDHFLIPDFAWLIIVLLGTTIITIVAGGSSHNIAYPAGVIWGLVGILVRYLPDFKFDVQVNAMWIVFILGISLLVITVRWIDIIVRRLK
ncbi:MAG: tryptophan-rich sensory protein [Clostridiales bacterium]|nr:tryptophan-rich sensory protein [Clostridiales bacterium]